MNSNRSWNSPIAALLLAALTATAAAHAAAPDVVGEPNNPEFKRLDANRDGYLSRDEAKKIRSFDKAFSEADDNRDGKLDAAEFVKAQAIYDRLRAGQFVDDSVITTKVKAALLKDRNVRVLDVKVETYKGTVLLSGFVDNEKQAQRAAEIASGIRGVTAVKNSLVVKG